MTIIYEWIVSKYEIARARQIVAPISHIPKGKPSEIIYVYVA